MSMIKCPNCGGEVPDMAKECEHCGFVLDRENAGNNNNSVVKKCPECGSVITEEMTVCPECGLPLVEKCKNGSKFKKIIPFAAGICAALICAVLVVFIIKNSNPVANYVSLLESNSEKAASVYEKKIKGNSEMEAKLENQIKNDSDAVYEKYLKDEISEEQAKKAMSGYQKSAKGNKYASDIAVKVDNLSISRANYNQAVEAENANDIETAYACLKNVIKEDLNYDIAEKKLKELEEKIKDSYITKAEEQAENKQFDDAIGTIDEVISIIGNSDDLTKLKTVYDEKKYEREYVDVRNAQWGDSKETAKKYEKCEILDEDSDGFVVKDSLDGKEVWAVFCFNENDQLYRVIYSVEEDYINYDYYIDAYNSISEKLTDKYGKASKVDNHRSYMADYCNSEGMALQLGYIAKDSIWDLDNMEIRATLYCPNDLVFLIAYTSKNVTPAKGNNDNY